MSDFGHQSSWLSESDPVTHCSCGVEPDRLAFGSLCKNMYPSQLDCVNCEHFILSAGENVAECHEGQLQQHYMDWKIIS